MEKSAYVQEVLDSSVRVVKGSTHSSLNLASLKAHGLHACDGGSALGAHGETGRVAASRGFGIGAAVGGRGRGRRITLSSGRLVRSSRDSGSACDGLGWRGGRSSGGRRSSSWLFLGLQGAS